MWVWRFFLTSCDLLRHKRREENRLKFTCSICEKTFETKKDKDDHEGCHATLTSKTNICKVCFKSDLEVDSLDIWKFTKMKNIHANFATKSLVQPRNFIITRKECMILKITGAKFAKNCLIARNMLNGIYLDFIWSSTGTSSCSLNCTCNIL